MAGEDGNDSLDFEGKPIVLPIIQIILARGPEEVKRWLCVVTKWNFRRVVPMHLGAPLTLNQSSTV
jgi:hypothetical protein